MLKSERFSMYSHLFGAITMSILLIIIVIIARNRPEIAIIDGLACLMAVFCLSASANYHAFKKEENEVTWRRKLDHIAIFFIIAGFFSALGYFYLSSPWSTIIIVIQWCFVILGTILKLFVLNTPRWITSGMYIVMGLTAAIPMPLLMKGMTEFEIFVFIAGTIILILGGIVYAIKWPDPKPDVFGFHDIFHIFILIGIFLYYSLLFEHTIILLNQ